MSECIYDFIQKLSPSSKVQMACYCLALAFDELNKPKKRNVRVKTKTEKRGK